METAGIVDVLVRSLGAIREAPEVLLVFLVVGPLQLVPLLGTIGQVLGAGLGVYLIARGMDVRMEMRVSGNNPLVVRLLVLFVSQLVAGILILLGMVALVLPGLYLAVSFLLITPAVVIDDCGPIEALLESWERVNRHLRTVAGVALVLFLITIVIAGGVLLWTAGGVDPAIQRVSRGNVFLPSTAAAIVGGPLGSGASTVMYVWFED